MNSQEILVFVVCVENKQKQRTYETMKKIKFKKSFFEFRASGHFFYTNCCNLIIYRKKIIGNRLDVKFLVTL